MLTKEQSLKLNGKIVQFCRAASELEKQIHMGTSQETSIATNDFNKKKRACFSYISRLTEK